MRYALLARERAGAWAGMTDESRAAFALDSVALESQLLASGVLLAGLGLDGVETATTVRRVHGEVTVTDGPDPEPDDHALAGVWLVEADDLDAALVIARRHPACGAGSVEIRPVISVVPDADLPDPPTTD